MVSSVPLDGLADWVGARVSPGTDRFVVGIVGPPGVGKSTVSAGLASVIADSVVVPMDGFHLAQEVLEEAGTADRKGAPHTFDAAGFVTMVERLCRPRPGELVYAPRFDRTIENPIAGAIGVSGDHRVVILEGNYLLVDEAPWDRISDLVDATVYLDLDPDVRLRRLIARHVEFGKTPEAAARHVEQSDEVNARLIATTRHRADLVVELPASDHDT